MAFRWIDRNIEHVAKHGVDQEEAEQVVTHALRPYPEQGEDDKWLVCGQGRGGRLLQVIFLLDEDGTVFVIPSATDRQGAEAIPKETAKMTCKQIEKHWSEMSNEELDRMAAEFDEEFVADTFQPLTAEKRAQGERARAKAKRAAKDNGERIIAVHLDRKLLTRCEALAKRLRITRDRLVARGLRAILAAHEKES